MNGQKLSSEKTWFFSRALPVSLYGLCALALYSAMRAYNANTGSLLFVAIPVVGAIAVFCVMRYYFHPIVDEVYDEGDFLRVVQGNQEHRIGLKDIAQAEYLKMLNPKIVEIHMKPGYKPAVFKFLPYKSVFSVKLEPEVVDLLKRINK